MEHRWHVLLALPRIGIVHHSLNLALIHHGLLHISLIPIKVSVRLGWKRRRWFPDVVVGEP